MFNNLQAMHYYETYYYANVIHNILSDTEPYLRNLNDWHEDREASLLVAPFSKWSLLHDFAEYIIQSLAYEQIRDSALGEAMAGGCELWVDEALRHHKFATPGFRKWLERKGVSHE